MIIYNVTSKVSWAIHDAWLEWMKLIHIPEVMSTGFFSGNRFVRLLETDEEDGPTYAIQYYLDGMEEYTSYLEKDAADLREKVLKKWGGEVISFRSLMEVIN
jgi:hypothetical protein